MSSNVNYQHTIYEVSDQHRELTPADLAFVCRYTGKSEQEILPHVLQIWGETKQQVWELTILSF